MNVTMCFQVDRINPVVTLDVTSDKSPVYSLEYNLQRYSFVCSYCGVDSWLVNRINLTL